MQLKDMGKAGDAIKLLNGFKSMSDIGASKAGKQSFNSVKQLLDGLTPDEAVTKLQKIKMSPELIEGLVNSASSANLLKGSLQDVSDAVIGLGSSSDTGLAGLKLAGTGLVSSLSTALPVIAVVGASLLALGAIDYFTVSYDEAAAEAEKTADSYNQTKSALESLNAELETTKNSINQLESMGRLSLIEEKELDGLKQRNNELERQTEIQESIAASKKRAASTAAITSLAKTDASQVDQVRKKYNFTNDPYYDLSIKDGYENRQVTDAQSIRDTVAEIKKYNKEIDRLEEKKTNSSNNTLGYGDIKKLEQYNDAVGALTEDLGKREQKVAHNLDMLQDDFGNVIDPKNIELVGEYNSALNSITRLDDTSTSKKQQDTYNIEDYFQKSSSSSINKYMTDMANAGASTKKMEEALRGLGLSSANFGGTELSAVSEHFYDIAKSAREAAREAEKVDGTLSGVGKALETKNSGDDFVTMSRHLDASRSWFDQGLTGTDEFKSVEKMVAGNTGQSYEEAMGNIQKYFTKDESGNLSKDGIQTFVDEFEALPETFTSTSEAADKMGLSLAVFEALIGRVSDYDGFEGVEEAFENMSKSSQKIEDAQAALSGLQEIYDSMEEGDEKNKLKISLDKWSSEIEAAGGDLEDLPEEKLTKLLFEYDKAELEKANEEARDSIKHGASNDTKRDSYAGIIANNEDIIEDTKQGTGLGLSVPLNDDLKDYEKKMEEAREYLSELDEDTEDGIIIEAQMDLAEAQEEYNDAMEEFDETGEVKVKIDSDDSDAKDKIDEINEEEMADKFVSLTGEDDATPYINLWNQLAANPKFSKLSAEDQASAVLTVYNSLNQHDKQSLLKTTDNATPVVNTANATSLLDKWNTLTTTVKTIYENVTSFFTGKANPKKDGTGANGTAHYYGTAYSQGTAMWQHYRNAQGLAYAGGNWGLNRTQNILMNELGNEIVVRDGRWMTFNNGFPTFANLKAGDIVFNHKQSRELLRNGYVTGSHASLIGGALANGSTGTALAKGTKEPETFIDKLSNFFDWCERRLDTLTKFTDRIFNSMERIAHLPFKQNEMYRALSSNRNNIDANRQAYDRYMSHANWVASSGGLSGDIQQKVQQGTMDITEYDDDTRKLIKSYEDYYDKAQDCADEIEDLIDKQAKYVKQALENVEDYYEMMGARDIANQKRIEAQMEYLDAMGESNTTPKIVDYLKEAKNNEAVNLDLAQGKYDTYKSEIDKLLASGYMAMFDKEWFAAQTKLKELETEIYESKTALEEFNDKLREVEYTKLQYVIDAFTRAIDRIKNMNSLTEAKGEEVTEGSYQKQINANNSSIKDNYNLRTKKINELSLYDVNSDKYKELAKDIGDIDDNIYGLLESNEKLKDSIREVRWQPFYDGQDALDDLIGETEDLRNLLNDDAFLDKNGLLTAEGAANIALISQGINAAKQMTADYTEGLKKLDAELKNGNLSQSEYDETQKDFLSAIRDSVDTVEDYKNELLDLNREQLEAEAEALQSSIDKRKEALRAKKDYYDYDKNVRNQTKDVNAIKAQMAALQGVTNASAQAEYKRLQAELTEKQDDLSETKKDHEYDMRISGYDKMEEDVDKALEDTLYEITHNAGKQQEVIANMLNQVVGMYGDAYGKINQIISNTGFVQSNGGKDNTTNLGSESGAKDQINNSLTNQGEIKPGGSAGNINTGPINNNPTNLGIEHEIGKEIDTSNRQIAELKISNAAISLQSGSTKALSISVRPTDAANKTMYWVSSMPEIASVSNGTVKALSAGNAMIICSTTDGSGLSATCSVTVTAPPPPPAPPVPPTPPALPHGGIPFIPKQDFYPKNQLSIGTSIVDRLKYHNFDSSMGACSQLYSYWGGSGGYSGSYSQNTWLLSKMAQAGYAGGTAYSIGGIARINELGEELIVRQHGNDYTYLTKGSGVVPADLTENLMKWGEINPGHSLRGISSAPGQQTEVYNHYDSLITVEGNVDKDALPDLKTIVKEAYKYTSKEFVKEVKKKL